ncbi:uncharacterized protein LOC126890040 isoform X3 [Diabrotica virgifera virgifera]|uniref:DUF5641 domain-containing protein n=1 Tax=Diabrotica virgifera virgifera TaxID=50390 RepID=A0ABM5KXA6_DIAVI|nr:uncharacterized protein LOC126890040 isoform X3 [Diabrotica virgifera virgifera]
MVVVVQYKLYYFLDVNIKLKFVRKFNNMEVKQEASEISCKMETDNETFDGPLDAFKVEIKEEPKTEPAYDTFGYLDCNEFPLKTEVEQEQDECKFTPSETKQTANENDPNDYEPLTPSHFLLGHPITSLPSLDLLEVAENRITRLQAVQRLQQQFWNRFSKEYISQLHQLYKWKSPQSKLSVGGLGLIRNDHLPPQKWQLGRILQLIPGPDGIHRVSLVSTTKGVLKRSVRHLHPLPLQDEASSSEN